VPDKLSLTATGTDMRLRYPEGFRSLVDADLALVGSFESPLLRGAVNVKSAVYDKRVDTPSSLLELVGATASGGTPAPAPAPASQTTLPLRYDVRIVAPSTLQVKNNLAQIVSNADLRLSGTYDRPLIFGRAEVERGRALYEGKQYLVTHGTIDFSDPTRIEPFFDFEAETRVRAQGQIYTVNIRFVGTRTRLVPQLTSDPPLPTLDILSLLFSADPQVQDAELRAVRQPGYQQQELVTSRILPAGVVDRLVGQTIGLDTFQITPSFVDPYQRLVPGARLTIGKRISNRVYLTFSRSLTSSTDPVIWMMEYDATDRLSLVLSRNEDNTYALDVRVRHVF
jgi:autotransporter translocation and assembly factor TamB